MKGFDADESVTNKNDFEENEELAAMKRRMTLVTAEENIPSDDEHPPDILYGDEVEIGEYSEEDDVPLDENHQIIEDIESDDECEPMTFQQMEALYKPQQHAESLKQATESTSKSAPQATQPTENLKPIEKIAVTDNTKAEELRNIEHHEDEELISDEEYEYSGDDNDEEYDNDIEEGDDISDVDDQDLMKRLEEKYGKLPQKPEQDAELEDDYDDDIDPTWTSKS